MDKLETRSLADSDRDSISELIRSVFQEYPMAMHFNSLPTELEISALFTAKMAGMKAGLAVDIVAVENGRIIGECEIVRSDPENAKLGIIVDREHRRKGVGSLLVDMSMAHARKIGIVIIYAEADRRNDPAMNFLRDMGFKGAGGNDERAVFSRSVV